MQLDELELPPAIFPGAPGAPPRQLLTSNGPAGPRCLDSTELLATTSVTLTSFAALTPGEKTGKGQGTWEVWAEEVTRVGIDVPTIGGLFHITVITSQISVGDSSPIVG